MFQKASAKIALNQFDEALDLLNQLRNDHQIIYNRALIHSQSKAIYQQLGETRYLADVLHNMAMVEILKGNYEQALAQWDLADEYALRSIITFENENKRSLSSKAKITRIEAQLESNKPFSSNMINQIDELISIFTELHLYSDLAKSFILKSKVYIAHNENEQALSSTIKALEIFAISID